MPKLKLTKTVERVALALPTDLNPFFPVSESRSRPGMPGSL